MIVPEATRHDRGRAGLVGWLVGRPATGRLTNAIPESVNPLEILGWSATIDERYLLPSRRSLTLKSGLMAHQLDPALQHALHTSQNELEVVDPSTNQYYVIVAKDRWLERTGDDEALAHDDRRPECDSNIIELWTDDKNKRRAKLVDRQIAGTLTVSERAELDSLQQQMRVYRDKVAPLPLDDTRQLHGELMEKARQAQKT